jgi:hypothetical protein
VRIGRDDDELRRSDAEESERPVDRDVAQPPDDDADRRAACEPTLAHVPSVLLEHRVPRGGEPGDVCHLAAGGQRERRDLWEPEHVLQPVAGDLLDHRDRRTERPEPGALVPDGREPVGTYGGG